MIKTRKEALVYEIYSSRWAHYISNDTLQTIVAKYYAWKVKRKYRRYLRRGVMAETIMAEKNKH